mmetsp:Transcript_6729/g.23759  ORF Transcript_6729/g.23759 Transcript_6729/m.23759 type:complete len:86 (+) Transcript_6729:755-1012(+)
MLAAAWPDVFANDLIMAWRAFSLAKNAVGVRPVWKKRPADKDALTGCTVGDGVEGAFDGTFDGITVDGIGVGTEDGAEVGLASST